MKKISASSTANVMAIIAVAISVISFNKSCQSMEITERQVRFNHKRQFVLTLQKCKLTQQKMVYEMENYLSEFPNDMEVQQLKLSIEKKIPVMDKMLTMIEEEWESYSAKEIRERQLGIEKLEMSTAHYYEQMNVMLKINE
jgi:hypothetical protein